MGTVAHGVCMDGQLARTTAGSGGCFEMCKEERRRGGCGRQADPAAGAGAETETKKKTPDGPVVLMVLMVRWSPPSHASAPALSTGESRVAPSRP